MLFLENVDRLLKSPAQQRGRDFAIMLASLSDLNYIVEWRVINAADYGMPQRRRRIFIFAFQKNSLIGKQFAKSKQRIDWVLSGGVFASAFPALPVGNPPAVPFSISGDLYEISRTFPASLKGGELQRNPRLGSKGPFENAGLMIDRDVFTMKTLPVKEPELKLDDVVYKNGEMKIPNEYFLSPETMSAWRRLKGAKKKGENSRTTKLGFKYNYNEGPLPFPDPLERPARTIITGEGGTAPSRFKHVVKDKASGELRRLIPEELEKLNMFPPGHTKLEGISDIKRAFFMGNALVVGVVERVGKEIARRVQD